uniref:Cold-inducible RNA-binding protein-like n=2 Tax=Nicotiana TaxID=4085 RepID=A0A1S3YWV3_TOBAC|nr:PREDICTED: cold-inducible RNA-binding protein [Nicotiana sylvestris]XP_016456540.1 PREDICTED: cold-inducible RNA-binding protein-like [Nicotiana tabacum]
MAKGLQLFVSRLSFYTTNERLKKLFSPFGVVTEARLVEDPRTQRPKGFGFVTFESEADARNALNSINGRVIPQLCW